MADCSEEIAHDSAAKLKRSIDNNNSKLADTRDEFMPKVDETADMLCAKVAEGDYSPVKRHGCGTCGMLFGTAPLLTRHLRVHTRERPFPCEVCKKAFGRKDRLTEHMRIHTGVKPYSCDSCGRLFTLRGQLVRHLLVHTGEKAYKCEICERCFSQKNTLLTHLRVHSREKPYECEVCHKTFGRRYTLIVHMRTHTNDRPYMCLTCAEAFITSSALSVHAKKHWGDTVHFCKKSKPVKKISKKDPTKQITVRPLEGNPGIAVKIKLPVRSPKNGKKDVEADDTENYESGNETENVEKTASDDQSELATNVRKKLKTKRNAGNHKINAPSSKILWQKNPKLVTREIVEDKSNENSSDFEEVLPALGRDADSIQDSEMISERGAAFEGSEVPEHNHNQGEKEQSQRESDNEQSMKNVSQTEMHTDVSELMNVIKQPAKDIDNLLEKDTPSQELCADDKTIGVDVNDRENSQQPVTERAQTDYVAWKTDVPTDDSQLYDNRRTLSTTQPPYSDAHREDKFYHERLSMVECERNVPNDIGNQPLNVSNRLEQPSDVWTRESDGYNHSDGFWMDTNHSDQSSLDMAYPPQAWKDDHCVRTEVINSRPMNSHGTNCLTDNYHALSRHISDSEEKHQSQEVAIMADSYRQPAGLALDESYRHYTTNYWPRESNHIPTHASWQRTLENYDEPAPVPRKDAVPRNW